MRDDTLICPFMYIHQYKVCATCVFHVAFRRPEEKKRITSRSKKQKQHGRGKAIGTSILIIEQANIAAASGIGQGHCGDHTQLAVAS